MQALEPPFSLKIPLAKIAKDLRPLLWTGLGRTLLVVLVLGLAGAPFASELDQRSETLPRLVFSITMTALVVGVLGSAVVLLTSCRAFSAAFIEEIRRAAHEPSNRISASMSRLFGGASRPADKAGAASDRFGAAAESFAEVAGPLLIVVVGIVVTLFISGGLVGLLLIGWRAL